MSAKFTLHFCVSTFCILHSSFLLAQTPYYHLNRSFSSVQFDMQGIPTEYQLNEESDKLTDIIQGSIQLDSNETYAIEKQTAIAIGYGSAQAAWNAAAAYDGTPSNYPGKTFDNVGWVRGTRSVNGEWGAYLWVLQNKITFLLSTSYWWIATNGIAVAITNVLVGSLGDYGPMENVVDIGPVIPSNFPGFNDNDSGTYQVDITNVYYELVIPDIWITPRFAVAAVDVSNVQYAVTGTNIPQGVNWETIPDLSGSGGATIISNGAWQAVITPGSVATNYIVRARSVDNTNFYDQVSLAVVKIEIKAADGVNDPPEYLLVNSSTNLKAVVTPSVQGDYVWATTSSNILLWNTNNQTVTIDTESASSALDAEEIIVAFAPNSGSTSVTTNHFITVIMMGFQEYTPCAGFDETLSPQWIMVPEGSNNLAKAATLPGAAASQIGFESDNTNIALVSPAQATESPQTITVTGVTNGSAEIWAKLIQSSNLCATLGVDVKKRINKTIAIHAITEENDDVQVIPLGQGQSNQVCITAGTNGVVDSTAGGDDVTNANSIVTGPDGICNTTASGDDVQVIAVGNGEPNAICVTKGANNFRDTNPSGDDIVNGDSIDTGTDGVCNTTANSANLVPTYVPSASGLEDYLNNTTWGRQANVHFTVTRSDFTVNYDLDRNGELADPWEYSATWAEINQITTIAKDTNINYNVYNVKVYEYPVALSDPPRAEAWIGDAHQGSTEYVTAHETGHLLGRVGHDGATVGIDLMGASDSHVSPYRIIKTDWDYVNQ